MGTLRGNTRAGRTRNSNTHMASTIYRRLWPNGHRPPYLELGKPDAGKPPVRFDEGREVDGHWPLGLSIRRSRLLYITGSPAPAVQKSSLLNAAPLTH